MFTSTLRDETADMRELALDELNQITGGVPDGSAGPAPAAGFLILMAAVGGIGAVAGYFLGHLIKGDLE